MIRDGLDALQRNWRSLLLYLGIVLPLHIANIAANHFFAAPDAGVDPFIVDLYQFVSDIVVAIGYAVAQTLVFARMGAEIDRPHWKYDGTVDSFRRFFTMWFILDLGSISLGNLMLRFGAEAGGGTQITATVTWIMIAGLVVPFGACVMFFGRVGKQELNESVNTLVAQFGSLIGVLFLSWAVSFFIHGTLMGAPLWSYPLLTIVDGYTDCLVFSCIWLICIYHRDEEPDDQDFDF